MAAWGITDELSHDGQDGWDGTDGNHPLHTLVHGNVVRETGVWAKQSSCWFQAKTQESIISHNLFFNGPRAMINMNE